MNGTVKELREFLERQATDFDNEMADAEIDGTREYDYAYAFGAREAYRFVTRWLDEYRAEEGLAVTPTLTGDTAIKYLADRYDWNIYCGDYGLLSVSAYRHKLDNEGHVVCDTSNFHTFGITMTKAFDEVLSMLLSNPDWADLGWIDHDDWVATERIVWLYNHHEPFAEWFKENIKEYEVKA